MTANVDKLKYRVFDNIWPWFTGGADFDLSPPSWANHRSINELEHHTKIIDIHAGGAFYTFSIERTTYIAAKRFNPLDEQIDQLLSDDNIDFKIVNSSTPNRDYIFLNAIYKLQVGLEKTEQSKREIDNIMAPFAVPGATIDFLLPLLEKFYVFECKPKRVEFIKSGNQMAFYLATYNSTSSKAHLSPQTIDRIRCLILEDIKYIPYNNLIHSIFNNKIEYSFLEIYKCMELVFSIPRILDLKTQLQTLTNTTHLAGLDVKELAVACSKQLGWRRVERDSIKKLFKTCYDIDNSIFNLVTCSFSQNKSLFKNRVIDSEKALDDFVSDFYYIRNQIAHQFWTDDIISISNSEYDDLIFFTATAISIIYNHFLSAQP
ncbi:hypothetical protein [Chromobacterium subtsugae]|uniref:hypothetical protein n=1 Tax=Chromobacterium subtsugae TaxID=251747 RepID=UPI000ADE0C17|nr:hypothetical protein [Chromobacterium subtsugae]